MMRRQCRQALHGLGVAFVLGALVACGGGGGSSPSVTSPPPPVTLIAPTFDQQPLSGSAKAGGEHALSAHATGSAPMSYQWFRGGVAIPGATSERLLLNPLDYSVDGAPYSVLATNAAGSKLSLEVKISVLPNGTPEIITGCREISSPGSYVLGNDITGANQIFGACLQIHDTHDVQLDCANFLVAHSVSTTNNVLELSKVRNFSVKNCRFDGNLTTVSGSFAGVISQSSFVYSDPTIPTLINLSDSTGVVLDRNSVVGGAVQFWHSDSATLSNNVIASGTKSMSGSVVSNFGVHTRIIGNTISGGWDGKASNGLMGARVGADDGIVISDETDVRVENNSIQNYWDCGIETLGFIQASTFSGNRIVRAEFCGIGGWYYSSLLNNVFANNTVEKSGNLFQFNRVYGLRLANTLGPNLQDTAVYFKDNVFEGNALLDPVSRTGMKDSAAQMPVYDKLGYNGVGPLPGEVEPKSTDFVLSNNVFRKNDFNALQAYAPYFGSNPVLPGVIVDGGGNKCQLLVTTDKTYPLACQ